jgi:hypothetical protein
MKKVPGHLALADLSATEWRQKVAHGESRGKMPFLGKPRQGRQKIAENYFAAALRDLRQVRRPLLITE